VPSNYGPTASVEAPTTQIFRPGRVAGAALFAIISRQIDRQIFRSSDFHIDHQIISSQDHQIRLFSYT